MQTLYFQGLVLFVLGVSALALWKGGQAERFGATVILINTVCDMGLAFLWSPAPNNIENPVAKLTLDGLTALAFFGLTVRYICNWLGAVMLLYGAQFALNLYYLVMIKGRDLFYAQANNILFLLVCISLAAGVLGHLRAQKALTNAS